MHADRRPPDEVHEQVFDLHASYNLPINSLPFDVQIFGHVFNVFDTVYIQDATDNSQYNAWDYDHDADDAEVYIGRPRTVNFGTRITF